MAQVRFNTVQDLFEAFPSAVKDVGAADGSVRSLDFLRSCLASRDWPPAISFCAYLLPRRVAVAWGCRTLRQMDEKLSSEEQRAIQFAEDWVQDPEEPQRRKALASGTVGNPKSPTTWVALAAGWSGGSIVPVEMGYAAPAPDQTARAIRVALLIALSKLVRDQDEQARVMTACLEDGIQLASGRSA
jgi:hypothetical protein